jgi:hypothetical protein
MNKPRFYLVIVLLFLVACSGVGGRDGDNTLTPDLGQLDTQQQIGTVVAGTQTAVAEMTMAAPPASPTPGESTMEDLVLTSVEANELANRWSNVPNDNTTGLNTEYCELGCAAFVWEGGEDNRSSLGITLIKASSRDEAVTYFNALKEERVTDKTPEIIPPELVTLPDGTYLFDARTTFSYFGLGTRRGSVVVLMELIMPDLGEDENLLFLSLFADRQIQKLIAAGY